MLACISEEFVSSAFVSRGFSSGFIFLFFDFSSGYLWINNSSVPKHSERFQRFQL